MLWYDDFNEVIAGHATVYDFYQSRTADLTGRVGGMRCVGQADVRIVPPDTVPGQRCDGVRGDALMTCSDRREIEVEWSLDGSCQTGYGRGTDRDGNTLHLVFGGSAARAEMVAKEALQELAAKPSLPPVGALHGTARLGIRTGTAFFVTWNGHLVTSEHVIRGASRIQVKLDDADLVDAELVTSDEENDLALLRVEAIRSPLPIRANHALVKGSEVFTLGYPLVQLQGQEQKATFGRVNALSGPRGDDRFTQVDVPIQPGNSGGPLINENGEVVGVITAMLHPIATLQVAGVIPQNVNYALKSDLAHRLLRRRLEPGWDEESSPAVRREPDELIPLLEGSVVLVVVE